MCRHTNKKGEPCKSNCIKGQDYCISHSPKEVQETAGFGGSQPGAGRPALPKPTDIARRLVEENAVALQRPYWRTLGYDVVLTDDGPKLIELPGGGAKVHAAHMGEVIMSDHDDLGAMMNAAERLQDRVHGKPKQQTEISGPAGGPQHHVIDVPAEADWHRDVAQILSDAGAINADEDT